MHTKRSQAVSILAFPVVLTIGILLIPVVPDYANHALAEQAVGQTARWFSGHLVAALGFSLSVLAVSTIQKTMEQLEKPLPRQTLPLVTLGAGLYAAGLGADGVGPAAVLVAGGSPATFFDGSGFLVTGIFITGTVLLGLGLLNLVIGSIRSGLLQGWSRWVSFISTLLFMMAPMVPSGWALYGVAMASFGIFVPFARAVVQQP